MPKPLTTSRAQRETLTEIIRSKAVSVVFQPIVDLTDGMIMAFEALCRPAPGTGIAQADDLFHIAGKTGLLWKLEEVTRGAALQTAANWPRDVRLFFNVSPAVFSDSRFSRVLVEELAALPGVCSDRIVLEITEQAQVDDDAVLIQQVQRAKGLGLQVAVDDAGAGTSGLNRMMLLRPQWIKLDRELVREIDIDLFRQNLVRFFVHFARLSGVNVIAEGIETPRELAMLMSLGVRFGQGYFLGRPGDRASTTDEQFAAQVRERWAGVDSIVPQVPHDMPLVRLCRPAAVVRADASIADAAEALARNCDSLGVIALEDGRRLSGWAARHQVLEVQDRAVPLRTSRAWRDAKCSFPPNGTVHEAVQMVCLREDHDLGTPLVLMEGRDVIGVIELRDLLRATLGEQRAGSTLRSPLTGLPARVRADQHLTEMLDRAADPTLRRSPVFHSDAAFVDVRRFADYNGVYGYEAGDRLIREVGDQIRRAVSPYRHGVFVAHLGDDRFLLTGTPGVLGACLPRLIENFERTASEATSPVTAGSRTVQGRACLAMGLRVLCLPEIFHRPIQPRDVYRAEQLLRQRARSQESSLPPGASIMISDGRIDKLTQRRVA